MKITILFNPIRTLLCPRTARSTESGRKRLTADLRHLAVLTGSDFPGIGFEWHASFCAIALRMDRLLQERAKRPRRLRPKQR